MTKHPVGQRQHHQHHLDLRARGCPLLYDARLVLHAEDHAEDVRVEGRGVAFRGLGRDRADLAFGAGVVHCLLQAPEACDVLSISA